MATTGRRKATSQPDVALEVIGAAEALVLLWDRAEDWAAPRVPPMQLRLLSVLDRYGPMNLTALARELGAIASSASRLCDRLEAAGLLDRQLSPDNRREVVLRVSAQGRRRLDAFATVRRADFQEVLARMSPDARAALVSGLRDFSDAAAMDSGQAQREA